ncbi:MAG: SRPBCC family protein [Actinomycetota bacterium]|nr:SRPBCC family protein [Actinomycetota bacterium]
MDRNFYRFRSEWRMSAPPADVYRALAELGDYPTWWPEVRSARQVDAEAFDLTCRSLLPYDLVFVSRQTRRDPDAGILEAHLSGDLDGFSRWTITGSSDATLAVFDEEVTANKALLRRLALIARPAFQLNHTLMMSHGRRGLRAYLAGMRLGRSHPAGS